MGRIAQVLAVDDAERNGVKVRDIKSDPGGGANITAEHIQPAGCDSHPLPSDFVALSGAAGSGRETGVGYFDPKNAPKTKPGEYRTYARGTDGAVMVETWLKNDGSCVITNGKGTLTLEPSGEFNINGARITTDGDVISATGVSLTKHPHEQPADSANNSQSATDAPTATE